MEFSEKVNKYFKDRKLSNRDVSKLMGGYNEQQISRFLNGGKFSKIFMEKLLIHFPELDMNYLIKDEDEASKIIEERKTEYLSKNARLIQEIEDRLKELKENLAQNSHINFVNK